MAYVLIACRCLLAAVFAASVVGKLRSRRAFGGFVSAVQHLAPRWAARSRSAARALAVLVAAGEAAAAVLLLVPGTPLAGFLLAAALLAAFTAAIAAVLRRGEQVACRCFGPSIRPLRPAHLLRNLVLLAAAGTGLALHPAAAATSAGLPEVLAAWAAGAFAALLVLLLDDILDLFTTSQHPRSLTAHDVPSDLRRRPARRVVPSEPSPHGRSDPAPEGAH